MKTLFRAGCFLVLLAFLGLNIYVELHPAMTVGIGAKLAFAASFTAIWSVVCYSPGGSPARRRGYYMALFGYYIWMLLNLLFFDAAFGRVVGDGGGLNTVPFLTIHNYLRAYELGNISLKWVLVNLLGNLAAFAPMGFFLPALFPKQRKIWAFVPSIAVMVALVEVAQYVTRTGSCDVDDWILNTAGACFVWLVCQIPPFRGWTRRVTVKGG